MNTDKLRRESEARMRRVAGGDLRAVGVDLGRLRSQLDVDRLRTQLADALETLGGDVRPRRRGMPLWGVSLLVAAAAGVGGAMLWRSRNQVSHRLEELQRAAPPPLAQAVRRGRDAVQGAADRLPTRDGGPVRTPRRAPGATTEPPG